MSEVTSLNIEIERKFLIKYPNIEDLKEKYISTTKDMVQTYLVCHNSTRRVRKITQGGKISYIFTEKKRINALSCFENEFEITEHEYDELLKEADPLRSPINKTRIAFEYKNHTLEIDLYDFWSDKAILEIELENENEAFEVPPDICIIKEVTDDKRFKNVNLSLCHDFTIIE